MVPRGSAASPVGQQRPDTGKLVNVMEREEIVAAHRELVEASDAVRHLLVVEDLTQDKIDEARDRLERAYERVRSVDAETLHV